VSKHVLNVVGSVPYYLAEGFYHSGASQSLKPLKFLIFIIKKSFKELEDN